MKIKKNLKSILLIGICIFLLSLGTYGLYFVYRLDKPKIIKNFQDPFILNNGTRVQTIQDWGIRQEEIKQMLLDIEYGHMPDHPDNITAKILGTEDLGGGNLLNTIQLIMTPNSSTPNLRINLSVWIYIPNGTGPFPTMVKVAPDGTGSQEPMSQKILDRGYIYVCYNHIELDPDTQGYDIVGPCQEAYPDYDWGSITVWAWGAMRVADFLLNESWVDSEAEGIPNIDPNVLIITGHSRRGKTALLAGALDERFSVVAPNGSGCCGAGSFLVQGLFSETIADITSEYRFKSWFQEDFGRFGGNEQNLPFDQHYIRALIAPRIIISTDATEDYWANPIGTQAVYEASMPVFEFLNATENNSIHYRSGGHAFTAEDFEAILGVSDKFLLGKNISGDFYMIPYDIDFPINYEAPK